MGRVLVVGSYNRDTVLRVERFPAPGETLAAIRMDRFHGGKGSNQAVAARRAGAQVEIIAAIGADSAGQDARALWSAEGIAAEFVTLAPGTPTGEAVILVDAAGENQIVIIAGANACLTSTAAAAGGGAAVILAQMEVPAAAIEAAFASGRARAAITILNAAPAGDVPSRLLDATDILVVNETEARIMGGREDAPEAMAQALLPRVRRAVVLTAGAAGAVWVGHGQDMFRAAPPAVTVVDSTGAGDAFVGALAAALADGLDAARALRRGVVAGALACQVAGAVPSLPGLAAILAAGGGISEPTRRAADRPGQ